MPSTDRPVRVPTDVSEELTTELPSVVNVRTDVSLIANVLPKGILMLSLIFQKGSIPSLSYRIVLSVAPLTIIPPPLAVVSEGPIAVNVTLVPPDPPMFPLSVIWSVPIEIIVVLSGSVIPTFNTWTSMPTIRPAVVGMFEITLLLRVAFPTKLIVATAPNSIALSSTVTTRELTVVVVPLTVRLPLICRSFWIVTLFGITTLKPLSPLTHTPVPEAMTNWLFPPGAGGAYVALNESSVDAGPIRTFPLPVSAAPA